MNQRDYNEAQMKVNKRLFNDLKIIDAKVEALKQTIRQLANELKLDGDVYLQLSEKLADEILNQHKDENN